MSWDPTPWFVGGGAQHSPEIARLLAYAATNGAEGVVAANDLKVTPLDVPGTAARVLPGAGLIANRSAGGGQQTYVARLPEADQVEIAATGSSGGRSDLIVAQVEDPNMPGVPWQTPADPTVGPYMFTRVIPNVPAGTTRLQDVAGFEGRSAITLARVDLPASTGTVTAAMITDLRGIAFPREKSGRHMAFPGSNVNMPTSGYSGWPAGIGSWVDIPEWATKAYVTASISGILVPVSSQRTVAGIRTYIGPQSQPSDAAVGVELGQNGILIDEGGTSTPRRPHISIAGIHDVRKYAGQRVVILTQAVRTAGNVIPQADYQSTCVIEWTFVEEAQ